jgi:excisionase family DNA binding protein
MIALPSRPTLHRTTPKLLSTTETARRLGVSDRTVLSWAQDGRLASIRTPGGHRRYPVASVEQVRAVMYGEA